MQKNQKLAVFSNFKGSFVGLCRLLGNIAKSSSTMHKAAIPRPARRALVATMI
jgi:hypothetical protein